MGRVFLISFIGISLIGLICFIGLIGFIGFINIGFIGLIVGKRKVSADLRNYSIKR